MVSILILLDRPGRARPSPLPGWTPQRHSLKWILSSESAEPGQYYTARYKCSLAHWFHTRLLASKPIPRFLSMLASTCADHGSVVTMFLQDCGYCPRMAKILQRIPRSFQSPDAHDPHSC
ncbi:uncharacterized protein LOC144376430 isoform X3 [Ictidomys tridecemlineatus]